MSEWVEEKLQMGEGKDNIEETSYSFTDFLYFMNRSIIWRRSFSDIVTNFVIRVYNQVSEL